MLHYSGRMSMIKGVWKYRLAALVLGGAMLCSLSACVPVMMVGGTVSGSMAATDRRTLGAQTEDKVINLKGENQASNIVGDKGHVSVTSFNRKVLLTGEVPNEAMKQAVGNAISRIDNVESVVNELAILAPSSFTSRSNDAFITGKVSASFVDAKDLFSNSLKTVTERGTVYLMGLVTEREGNRAAQVAGGVNGVQKVVKVFEYISDEQLQKLSTLSAPNNEQAKPASTDTRQYAQ
ncbi:transporter [Oxalobacter formigenes OXCC13]|nr:transporter [Oxalobacter formigenes OXCC13]